MASGKPMEQTKHTLDGVRFEPMDNLLDTRFTNVNIVPGLDSRAAWLQGHGVGRDIAEAICIRLNSHQALVDAARVLLKDVAYEQFRGNGAELLTKALKDAGEL